MKYNVILLFISFSTILCGQDSTANMTDDGLKLFKLTNGFKTKIIKQSDYFTVYLFNQHDGRKNEIYEGFLLEAENKTYEFDVFFEEYETLDDDVNMLMKERCDLNEHCDRFMSFSQQNIEHVEHNTNGKISLSKISFVTSFGALLASSYLLADPQSRIFSRNDGTYNTGRKAVFTSSGLGLSILSFGLGIKLMTPHQYHFNYRKDGQKATWWIEE